MASVLRCRGITKSFRRHSVLRGVDLELARGESIAVVGENGSGKSTLLEICAGVQRAEAGDVDRPATVGFCPQVPGLVDLLTIDEHIRLASAAAVDPVAAERRVAELLEELHLDRALPTPAVDLSGGQRQKLNVALSLSNDPQLLLLDEPYQGFDHGSYVDLWSLIERWAAEGRAVVVITHLLAEADRVDRVLTMADGVLR